MFALGIDTVAVAVVPPPVNEAFGTVANTVPPEYGSASAVVEYLKMMPYVDPMSVKPACVSMKFVPAHTGLALAVNKPIVGHTLQPPGPDNVYEAVDVQPLPAVTVTK